MDYNDSRYMRVHELAEEAKRMAMFYSAVSSFCSEANRKMRLEAGIAVPSDKRFTVDNSNSLRSLTWPEFIHAYVASIQSNSEAVANNKFFVLSDAVETPNLVASDISNGRAHEAAIDMLDTWLAVGGEEFAMKMIEKLPADLRAELQQLLFEQTEPDMKFSAPDMDESTIQRLLNDIRRISSSTFDSGSDIVIMVVKRYDQ